MSLTYGLITILGIKSMNDVRLNHHKRSLLIRFFFKNLLLKNSITHFNINSE